MQCKSEGAVLESRGLLGCCASVDSTEAEDSPLGQLLIALVD